jgi:Na+-driven multidrug efflux pump
MISTIAGAVMNIVLDPLLIFKFDMGMQGAAIATITGQIVSAVISLMYLRRFKSVKLNKSDFRLNMGLIGSICLLGLPSGLNQLAVITVQILLNNTLGHYGELSVYGREIPLAVVGIVSKVSAVFNSIVMGISQSCQPIFGYNYGAENYKRVKSAFKQAFVIVTCVSSIAFILFQAAPHQILEIFQKGNDLYLAFGTSYLRIYMFFIFLVGSTILTAVFFPAIGVAKKGIVASVGRQMFQLPLIVIMPLLFGLDGVLYAGPLADLGTFVLCMLLVRSEFKNKFE